MGQSIIYRHILWYRIFMNVLYRGKYKQRFAPIIDQIKLLPYNSKILELCFGDVVIAEHCKRNRYEWTGLDINKSFVKYAQKQGYFAQAADLTTVLTLPSADLSIIIGSLYHFHSNTQQILGKILQASDQVIISEPVLNLSSSKGIIGAIAKRSANAGKGNELFRYTRSSFLDMVQTQSGVLNFQYEILSDQGKDLIVKLVKKQ
jgi:hypothetical protein